MHSSNAPIQVSVEKESKILQDNDSINNQHKDSVFNDIILSTPHRFKQFVAQIIKNLKIRIM